MNRQRQVQIKQKRSGFLFLFLWPSLIGFAVFYLLPFLLGFYYSLVESPVNGHFAGLTNYRQLLTNLSFLKAAKNTAVFTAIAVPLNMGLSLGLAMLLSKQVYGRKMLRTLFITPLVVPVASVVLVWQAFFDLNGSLNAILSVLGIHTIDWMKTGWARVVVIVVYLWKNVGYSMILFLAGLQNIPVEYYEAARIDGATPWQELRNITLIYLMPTTFFVFIISIINSFKVFRETYLIAGDYPQDGIYLLQHFMNNMFQAMDYQKLTSAAFVMAAVITAVVFVLFKIERKMNKAIN